MRTAVAVILVALAVPTPAQAHGISGGTTLPVPDWLVGWAAAAVLIVSFVALAVLWPTPRLATSRDRPVARLPRWLDWLAGAAGAGLFALVVYAGLTGTQNFTENLTPTFVFVAFWVGVPMLSAVFGDIFRVLSPWRAAARATAALIRRIAPEAAATKPVAYPTRLGRWPAALMLLAFAWLELVYVNRDDPSTLALLALGYAAVQMLGMTLFGIETWTARADGFGVYFSLVARLAPLTARGGRLYARRPLSGLPGLDCLPGTIAVVLVLLGSTTFDGLASGPLWLNAAPHLQHLFQRLGLDVEDAGQAAFTIGLIACILVVAGFYWLCVRGMRSIAPREHTTAGLADRFAHTLTPVALGYVLAHYFSLLVFGGQSLAYLMSDPLGDGANLFGTASWQVHYTVLSATAIWLVQVALLTGGHVGGLMLAHERALTTFRRPREAVRSQYWSLCVMVGFTCLGLWLLSAANA